MRDEFSVLAAMSYFIVFGFSAGVCARQNAMQRSLPCDRSMFGYWLLM